MSLNLTLDQKEASNKFLGFLLSNETEFYLYGAAGCGKTFLTQHFITNVIPQYKNIVKLYGLNKPNYEVIVTATTNKAASILQKDLNNVYVDTIYKAYSFYLKDDYRTGKKQVHKIVQLAQENKIVFIDECSMLPQEILEKVKKASVNCKFVYIGDKYQLTPVNAKSFQTPTDERLTAELITPVRNNKNNHLVSLCSNLRATVANKGKVEITTQPGSIDHLDTDQVKDWLKTYDYRNSRILCYTNNKALKYIDYCRDLYGIKEEYEAGREYVMNSSVLVSKYGGVKTFYSDEPVVIQHIAGSQELLVGGQSKRLKLKRVIIQSLVNDRKSTITLVPEDREYWAKLIKESFKNDSKNTYFELINHIADIRIPFATTIHKSQGSTFDEVLIDLDSFKYCKDPDLVNRLLYVAVSRAKNRVLFYGSLPKQFGRIV